MRSTPAGILILAILIGAGFLSTETADASTARILVKSFRLADNGDNDGFADPNEMVDLFVTLRNVSDTPRTGIGVALVTDDSEVDCLVSPVVPFGSLGARETREAAAPLRFRLANVGRASVDAEVSATFKVLIWGDDFDGLDRPQELTLDLDLDVTGGLLPSTFTEGFEAATFGGFTTMTLDVGKASVALSNGHRCQYNDPPCDDTGGGCPPWHPCYLGFPDPADNAFDWHVHGATAPDGGRAYLGGNSLHWGVHAGPATMDTTRLKQLDAIQTGNPIFLGWNGVKPELSFKHQVGLTDYDHVEIIDPGESVDRGVVQVQLANVVNSPVGPWRKISPYENLYDVQGADNFTNCTFDPTDDGNDEDDYFDPADPGRRFGPSSTCYPEFSFSRIGEVRLDDPFDPSDVGHATDGPGLMGSLGHGTWVESKFDLSRWRGRRMRLRFLATSLEVGDLVTMQQVFVWNPTPADDGWYIDDVRVTNTLTSAATVSIDTADRSGLPACAPGCTTLTASLTASPSPTGTPGEPSLLDASASTADVCPGGLLYRFWHDENGDGALGGPGDVLLRDWTDRLTLQVAPTFTTSYMVEVRCSSLAACAAQATAAVAVPCPKTPFPFVHTLEVNRIGVGWGEFTRVDVLEGDLMALRVNGGQFQGTVRTCLADDAWATGVATPDDPGQGAGFYYLVRQGGLAPACARSWGTGVSQEVPGRNGELAADPNGCP